MDGKFLCACLALVGLFCVNVDAATNLALNQPAWQSSTWDVNVPGLAVEGSSSSSLASCSQTDIKPTVESWWAVDLGSSVKVQSVKITNRDDYKLIPRSAGVVISTSNTAPPTAGGAFHPSDRSECAVIGSYLGTSATVTFTCRDDIVEGRYLYIHADRPEYLTLCEVQVFGA